MADKEPQLLWNFAYFNDLAVADLYDIIGLRNAVFIVEQDCPYQDCDGVDRVSHHLWMRDSEGKMAAYLRIVPPGVNYAEPSLGRIVTSPDARGTGLGRAVVREGFTRIEELYGPLPIRIGAQRYLLKFYEELGFASTGREYEEDDIPHTEMLRPAS
jgi:ElaA protein